MTTSETLTSAARADDATALYWELELLRGNLNQAAEEYDIFTGTHPYQDLVEVLPGPLGRASAAVRDVQAALAEMIVKQAGPAADSR